MPLSSLSGGYGIGSMGALAHKFVDFLAAAGQTIWQILPVGPTGYADSPYQRAAPPLRATPTLLIWISWSRTAC